MDESSSPSEGLETLGKSGPITWSSLSSTIYLADDPTAADIDFLKDPGGSVTPNSSNTAMGNTVRDAVYYMESTFVVFEVLP